MNKARNEITSIISEKNRDKYKSDKNRGTSNPPQQQEKVFIF